MRSSAAIPFAALFARVVVRAIRALHSVDRDLPAATVGLFSPRVLISSQFAAAVDPRALEAAREHENAHARHRDPLRLWLAQIATDLQWPWSPARARFEAWTEALEFARDEEARARNIEGADLAAAVLVAVRMYPGSARSLAASMTGDARALKERIARLMAPPMSDIRPKRERATIAILVGGLFCVVVLGATFGEPVVSTMTASRGSAHAGAGGTDQQRR